ncbi:hypothetical protein BO99DRAFT_407669 [Aspergillus violaceofuscus CBS 115571]|uniref:Uncharacterized protein n=1 Tax=Aspergillus violaceofuscus (strain CBS 115571) TaxID=1450538 RepID=A0A2V5HMP6_ASPV1|nr:hypothetical protein BO99DRAFT_407669 [Aspergillus violaceofuscus CBS 115571]
MESRYPVPIEKLDVTLSSIEQANANRDRGTRYRGCYVWLHIKQEDLLSPKALLLFLNARGRNPPSNFAATDMDAMHLGLVLYKPPVRGDVQDGLSE